MAVPLKNIEANTITNALFKDWISLLGTPLTITTDQGSQCENTLLYISILIQHWQILSEQKNSNYTRIYWLNRKKAPNF